jgi:hypothetical protein
MNADYSPGFKYKFVLSPVNLAEPISRGENSASRLRNRHSPRGLNQKGQKLRGN